VETEIDEILDRLQPIGEALGDEAVVAVPRSITREEGMPLFMAEVEDAAAFRAEIEELVERANLEAGGTSEIIIVDDPRTASPSDAEVLMWVEGSLFAAASDLETLQALAARVDNTAAQTFRATLLHSRLAQAYAEGISWLMGGDIATAVSEAVAEMPADEAEMMRRLGFLDITTLLVERHRDGEWYATNAELLFSAQRTGIMSWLAAPAPMGSLEFVSPNAYIAASAVTRDPAEMFDELLTIFAEKDGESWAEFQLWQQRVGVDLREDFAAALGGEATFALDGPMLPVPAWKLIVEVYDPAVLVHALRNATAELNRELAVAGEPAIVIEEESAAGRTYYTIHREGLEGLAVMTSVDGYLVIGPNRAVVDQAIAHRASGVSLPGSEAFRALLPDNVYTDCSALVYRDLDSLMNAVPPEMLEEFDVSRAFGDGLGRGLVCIFGGEDRITASATGGSLLGIGSVFGMAGAIRGDGATQESLEIITEAATTTAGNAVSSTG